MAKTAYPVANDLTAWLSNAGLTTSFDATTAVAAGIYSFENRVNRKMLVTAASSQVTYYYDPPVNRDAVLDLAECGGGKDLAESPTIVLQPYGGSAATLTNRVDYVLEPRNALAQYRPIERVRFLNRRWTLPLASTLRESLQITGRWGYVLDTPGMPEDAWSAMLLSGVLWLWEQAALKNTDGGLLSWKEGDVSEDYGVQGWENKRKAWEAQVEQAVAYYRRTVGV